ncbi:hypothetical protein J437_LFUL000473 [Ladona fulva]|uniref:Ras-like protein family member 10B n=1 Tax=Ladona fulva TaxID=123851 RepID=A0A8K0KLN7_LADFU|nr:hypothetical protein J437_LFUL000473 [Ladona fulva]
MKDLDLDYLEKGEREKAEDDEEKEGEEDTGDEEKEDEDSQPNSQLDDHSPPETTDLVKIILLGAPAVGKTSIVQQFVWNDFCDAYYPTDRRHCYYPSVIINGRLYDLKISDLPPVPYFPVDSLYEWTDFRSYGLRSATAYVLVFDLSNAADTFHHIKCLREQMANSRDMRNVPVVVVGNKHDRLHSPVGIHRPPAPPGSFFGMPCLAHSSGLGTSGTSSSLTTAQVSQGLPNINQEQASSLLFHQYQQQQNALAMAEARERRDIANIVKKHWRCGYVECSAKYNWRVVSVFKELMQAIDGMEGRGPSLRSYGNFAEVEQVIPRSQCVINKEAARSFTLRRQRTPMVVNNIHNALEGSRCDVL